MNLENFKEELKALMDTGVLNLSVEEYETLIEWAKEQGWGF
jgi:hypothetical protein